MPTYQFSHASFTAPSKPEYVALASGYIAEIAPTLPPSLRDRVAELTAGAMFSLEGTSAEVLMDDPTLRLGERWCWPEAESAFPFSLADDFGLGWQLWRGEQWSAKTEADWLLREANGVTLEDWLYNVPMTLVRQWRDHLLPDRAKKGSKFVLLLDLKKHPDFGVEVTRGYQAWRQDLISQAEVLMVEARKPPVPRHLQWLVRQVMRYLDNYHTSTNSAQGPAAFLSLRQRLEHSAMAGAPPLNEVELHRELEDVFALPLGGEMWVSPIPLAWGYIEMLRGDLSPRAILRKLDGYAPGKLICSKPCGRCAPKSSRKPRNVAPFDILCCCHDFTWVPKPFQGSVHDWKFGQKVDLDAAVWAYDRLLDINDASLDAVAFYVRARKEPWEDRYQRDVGALLKRGQAKAEQYAQLASDPGKKKGPEAH